MVKLLKKWGWFKKAPKKESSPPQSNFGKPSQSREIENLEKILTASQHGLLANLKNIINDEN